MASTASSWSNAYRKTWGAFEANEIPEWEYRLEAQERVEEAAAITRAANTPAKRLRAAELTRCAESIRNQTEQHIAAHSRQ